jgi:hypothetical protein
MDFELEGFHHGFKLFGPTLLVPVQLTHNVKLVLLESGEFILEEVDALERLILVFHDLKSNLLMESKIQPQPHI